jgi:hypothetical protein
MECFDLVWVKRDLLLKRGIKSLNSKVGRA